MEYCVGTTTDNPNHNHEVHKKACPYYPSPLHRIDLGECSTSKEALEKAKRHYPDADGCRFCCDEIHYK